MRREVRRETRVLVGCLGVQWVLLLVLLAVVVADGAEERRGLLGWLAASAVAGTATAVLAAWLDRRQQRDPE